MTLSFDESAAAVGGFRWCELATWRACSAWATTTPVAAAAVCLDVVGAHAAWRADQWWQRLPVLASVERSSLVVPPPGWAAVDDALAAVEGAPARLAVTTRVLLGRLAAGYAAIAGFVSPVADGPLARTLAQAQADVAADWQRSAALLTNLLVTGEAVDDAAAAVSGVEHRALGGDPGEAAQ
ncbi:MAG TPA: hypothetical protein VFP61_12890 [Acidimicrobiales bacterium]|nr:hypothetical protein [Acidimicrobiales bacterium]